MTNLDALQQAMKTLKGSGLKMWLYLNKNQDNYRLELSRQTCLEWGIKKDSYYDGISDLIQHGYLRMLHPGSNIYYFYEDARAENQTSGESEFYFTETPKMVTEKTKAAYGFQKQNTENPYRNNTYNTEIVQNNTMTPNKIEEREKWRKWGL